MMHVGVCQMSVHIPGSRSLKDRRQIVRSLCGRLRSRFDVSVADVGGQDTWQSATLGVVTVNRDAKSAAALIDRVIEFTEVNYPDVQVIECDRDVLDLD